MRGRALAWIGAGVLLLAALGLIVYFAVVGLGQADKLGSAIGAIVAVAGLGVTIIGLMRERQEKAQQKEPKYHVSAPGAANVAVGDRASIQVSEKGAATPAPTSGSTRGAASPIKAGSAEHATLKSEVEALRAAVAAFDPGGVPAELLQRLAQAEAKLDRVEASGAGSDTNQSQTS
jgi:hypothetical protein